MATRNAGSAVMNAIAEVVPELFGGAADLTASTKTIFKDSRELPCRSGGTQCLLRGARVRHVRDGERHGGAWRAGAVSGRPSSTSSDYAKPAMRLAALMRSHSIFVFTHDSIGLGEDGPTHQPIEQLMMLRAVPQPDRLPAGGCERDCGGWQAGAGAQGAVLHGADRGRICRCWMLRS